MFADISDFGTYYWRVKAGNDAGLWSEYSSIRYFTWYTTGDINPVPVSPPSSPPIWKHEAIITWTPPSSGYYYWDNEGVFHYIDHYIDVATDSSFTNKIIDNYQVFGINYWDISSYVTENQTYYWRVRAQIDGGVTGDYGTSSFTVKQSFNIQEFVSEFDRFNPYGGGVSTFAADLSEDTSGTPTWTISVAGRTYNGSGSPAYFTWDGKNDAGMLANPGTYTLAGRSFSFTPSGSDTLATLSVDITGTGTGWVTTTPVGVACNTSCFFDFPIGTPITLHQAASQYSSFTGWSGGGCSGMGDCELTLTANTLVSAIFTSDSANRVRVDGGITGYYSSLQGAYDATHAGAVIKLWATDYTEDLTCWRPITVTLQGGYDETYATQSGDTVLNGTLTISYGTVIVNGISIR